MKENHQRRACLLAVLLPLSLGCQAAVLSTTAPGTGAPPGTLGGFSMGAFPADLSAEGTMVTQLTPPAAAPVIGDLYFTTAVEHLKAGSLWDTWSHGYTGDVYYNADFNLMIFQLPQGTMAFSLYIQPNLKDVFNFKAVSGVEVATLDIDGDGGASYVGFWSDDPLKPLQFVYIEQTTDDSDGFAVGEFMINVPEPGAWGLLAGLGLCGWAIIRRGRS